MPERLSALIVDDNAYARSSTAAMLRKLGISKIAEAAGGVEAVTLLHSEPLDVLVMDWYMPEVSGAGLIGIVRRSRHARLKSLPVIVMTGYASRETIGKARELGAGEVLTKPFTPEHLSAALRRVLPDGWGAAAAPGKGDDQFFL